MSQQQQYFRPVSLSSKLYDEICARIRDSYPKSCILYIDEISNHKLQESYQECKAFLESRRTIPIQEKRLFHGTSYKNIDSIARNGFQTAYNARSAFGKGTYFATDASYSREYTNLDQEHISYMFLCDVLVGNCVYVSGGRAIDTKIYDNGVNNLEDPTIYVCPYNEGCYPRYLIAFHKNAAT